MMKPYLTFTGVDVRTPIDKLPKGPEYGILWSMGNNKNRYPALPDLLEILMQLKRYGHDVALHVCGSLARKTLILGGMDRILGKVDRVQVNGRVTEGEVWALRQQHPTETFIYQYNETNRDMLDNARNYGQELLVDASGGQGVMPDMWVKPLGPHPTLIGFAGGLSPENIRDQLPLLEAAAGMDEFWIDMETGVRTNDWFDVEKVKAVVAAVEEVP